MSGWTRRRFLTAAGLVTLGVAAGTLGWSRRRLIAWLANPGVPVGRPGTLSVSEEQALLLAVRTTLDDHVTESIYLDFFRWRALNVPGYLDLYREFVAALNHDARRRGAAAFVVAPPGTRRGVMATLAPRRRWDRLVDGVLRRDQRRFERYVVRDFFRLYAGTDGWLRAGYDTWPGRGAGLVGLDRPPRRLA